MVAITWGISALAFSTRNRACSLLIGRTSITPSIAMLSNFKAPSMPTSCASRFFSANNVFTLMCEGPNG